LGGEILYADRFGNALTSLGVFARQADRLLFRAWLPGVGPGEFSARETRLFLSDGRSLPLLGAYGQIPSGEYAALIGSAGLLEIAADRANAAQSLGLEPGTFVTLTTLSR
jgi:S-adenosylmethionine hydrolase